MAVFDGDAFDDGGLHTMSMVADGQTVKLLLDGIEGAEVQFPFSPVIFQFGSYARPMMTQRIPRGTTWSLSPKAEPPSTPVQSASLRGLSQPVNVRIPKA